MSYRPDPNGYYDKFQIRRRDGKPNPANACYFVLDFANDPHARVALAAYADSIEGENPTLADDLRFQLGAT